jgi:rubrerythrin
MTKDSRESFDAFKDWGKERDEFPVRHWVYHCLWCGQMRSNSQGQPCPKCKEAGRC